MESKPTRNRDAHFAKLEAQARAGNKAAEAEAQKLVDDIARAAGFMELFHGSSLNEDVKIFEDRETSSGAEALGIYMSPEREVAERYGKTGRYWVDIKLPGYAEYEKGLTLEEITQQKTIPTSGKSKNGAWIVQPWGIEIVVRYASQIKSSAPFTYDDKGNLIPISQRFQTEPTKKPKKPKRMEME